MRKITKRIIDLASEYEELEYESYKYDPLYAFVWVLAFVIVALFVLRNGFIRVDSWVFICGCICVGFMPLVIYYHNINTSKRGIRRKLIGIMEHNKNKPETRVELKNHMIGYQRRINDILGYSLEWCVDTSDTNQTKKAS